MNDKMIKILHLALILVSVAGCSSTGGYLSDRERDALDFLTLSIGSGGGIKARASIVNSGIFMGTGEEGFWAGNVLGCRSETADINSPLNNLDLIDLSLDGCFNYQEVRTIAEGAYVQSDPRGKNFTAKGYLPFYSIPEDCAEYYTQCEVAVGLFYYLRLGVNFGEMLDFVLGWTTLDIYGDDIENR